MKKWVLAVVVAVSLFGFAGAVDYSYITWTPTISTSTFNVPNGAVVKNVKLINATTAYINFQVKASSSNFDYILVAPRDTEITSYSKYVNGFTVTIAPNQPPIGGFDGLVSSASAVGTIINYSK